MLDDDFEDDYSEKYAEDINRSMLIEDSVKQHVEEGWGHIVFQNEGEKDKWNRMLKYNVPLDEERPE